MGAAGRERLTRLLGDPDLAWLLGRVRSRLERGRPLDGAVTLADASPAQRRAVERLLGRAPRPGGSLSVSLPAVDELLRRSGACPDGLAGAAVELGGPVVVKADAAAAREQAWERAFVPLAELVAGRPELADWLRRLRASGLVKRLEPDAGAARALLRRLADVIAALPVDGEPIGRFAARIAAGAHALDDGAPLATLALDAARALAGLPARAPDESPAEWRREVWAAVGLLRDELSSAVLTIGLASLAQETGTGRLLHAASEAGQPMWLTLRQLVRDPPEWAVPNGPGLGDDRGSTTRSNGVTVHVCENPVLVAIAADALGSRCPPLICTNGQPVAATMVLLRQLAASGALLAHHGDFDWGGIRIGNVLHARLPICPWRFDAETYARVRVGLVGPELRGARVAARWDAELAPLMHRHGRGVEEEVVADELLADLEAGRLGRSLSA